MRLIDADLFLQNVRKELNCDERCCECVHGNLCEVYKMTLKQPTAYDVDKVVEEMKKVEKETLIKTEGLYKNLNLSPAAIFSGSNSALVMLGKCIEIVKSGFYKGAGNE